jgi:hypothetical protein
MAVYNAKTKVAGLGYPGAKGDKGDTGDQGIQGIQGIQGPIGETGAQGIQGIQGETGATGAQGIQGEVGPQGIQGTQGIKGDTGDQGIQGIQGPIGETGPQGIQGEQGIQGPQGVKGDTGDTGPAGLNGTGVPDGGTTGQLLAKESNDNGDFIWIDPVDILNVFYPVGTIYQSVSDVNPGTFMGGTWTAWGAGKFIVGVDTGQTEFDTVEETGGAKKINLTSAQLPAHAHTIDHDHGVVTSTDPSANHTHNIPAMATGGRTAAHTHTWGRDFDHASGSSRWGPHLAGPSGAGATSPTGTESADHAHYTPSTTSGTVSAWHTHNVDIPNYTGNSGNGPGTGADINILNPYITCYFWKRTA